MTTATPSYASANTLTCTLASLASDASLLAGRQSTAADQATDDCIDAHVGGKVTTGTSPTASRQIEIWAFGSYDGTTYSAGAGASDAGFTPTGEKGLMRLLLVIPTDGTTNHTYEWGPVSIAQAFGGVVPRKWGIYIVHNTGVNLNATAGNHEVKYIPIKIESA